MCLQWKLDAAEHAHNTRHNQTLLYVIGLRVTNDFKLQTSARPRERKRFSIMPCQTPSTKQSELAEFCITRLDIAWIRQAAGKPRDKQKH